MSGIWDSREIEDDLRRRWKMDVAAMPSRRIADEMSVTWAHAFSPNAIIGRAHRLRLPCRTVPRGEYAVTRARKPPRVRKPPPPPEPRPEARVVLVGIERACCYPLGTPRTPEFRYCEAPAVTGKSYCPEHHRLAHQERRAA